MASLSGQGSYVVRSRGINVTVHKRSSPPTTINNQSANINTAQKRIGIYDQERQQSRLLTPFEQTALDITAGKSSQPVPNTFSQQHQTVYHQMRTAKPEPVKITSYNVGAVRSAAVIDKGISDIVKRQESEQKRISERERAVTGSKADFNRFIDQERYRQLEKAADIRPAYGDLSVGASGFQKSKAYFSIGAQRIGIGMTGLIDETRLRIDRTRRSDINKPYDDQLSYAGGIFKSGGLAVADLSLRATSSLIEGGVTGVGRDKTQAAFVVGGAGLGVLGGLLGKTKLVQNIGTLVSSKVVSASRTGFTGVVGGLAVGDIATSGRPFDRTFEIAGEFLSIGGGYQAGRGAGRATESFVKSRPVQIAIRAPAYGMMGSLPGRGARGSGRVMSKAMMRDIGRGAYRDPRVSYADGKIFAKVRSRELKEAFVKQRTFQFTQQGVGVRDKGLRSDVPALKGSAITGGRARFRTSQAVPRSTDFRGVDYVMVAKRGFRKPVKVSVPRQQSIRPQELASPSGSGFVVQQTKMQRPESVVRSGKGFSARQVQNQGYLLPDPSRSQYSAQNIAKDVKVDVNDFARIPEGVNNNLRGGFRSDRLRSDLFSRVREQKSLLDAKSFVRDLSFAELPGPNLVRESVVVRQNLLMRSDVTPRRASLFDVNNDLSVSSLSDLRSGNVAAQDYFFDIRSDVSSLVDVRSDVDSIIKSDNKSKIDVGTDLTSKPSSRSIRSPATGFTSFQPPPQESITPRTNFFRQPRIPRLVRPRPDRPRRPPRLLLSLPGGTSQRASSKGFFSVFVRRKGKFSLAGRGFGDVGSAKRFGIRSVGGSAAATFKIKDEDNRLVDVKGTPRGFYRKGALFIEKRSRRIKSPGELREITFKGLAAQRNRRGGFFAR